MSAMAEMDIFAAMDEAIGVGAGKLLQFSIISIMTAAFTIQQNVQRMMKIIQPLPVKALASRCYGLYRAGVIEVGFCNEVKRPAGLQGPLSDRCLQIVPDANGIAVIDLVDGVETQTVEMVMLRPMKDIACYECSYAI